MLAKLPHTNQSGIVFNEHMEGSAQEIFEHACRLDYEGILCKRVGSRHASGRSTDSIKLKKPGQRGPFGESGRLNGADTPGVTTLVRRVKFQLRNNVRR